MSDHTKTIVPLHTWWYASPELVEREVDVDIGLFSEALVYYEQVWIQVDNLQTLSTFVSWFIKRDLLDLLQSLINDDVVRFYNFAFSTMPLVTPEGIIYITLFLTQ